MFFISITGDGTFTVRAADWLKHSSFSGMGVDIADFNNDGWADILQVDMMPEELRERKRTSGSFSYEYQEDLLMKGFNYRYPINTLNLSHGITPEGDLEFSEIARQAGVAYTHWRWSSLFVDADNDGHKDIFITNGFPKAINDIDYLFKMYNINGIDAPKEQFRILNELHSYEVADYFIRNKGDMTFADIS